MRGVLAHQVRVLRGIARRRPRRRRAVDHGDGPAPVGGALVGAGTRTCPHPRAGWGTAEGVATCGACGVRRFLDYGALWRDVGERRTGPAAGHRFPARMG
ncbi:DUF6255 family natural product biosynthesis protein [Streptomyces triculaminicus]|uniref:DUF6255 family natural product biosynthesis protein n=1 Tax=Streptomyces triculaminicus TaxID=2816232 RepID=UPI0037D03AFE